MVSAENYALNNEYASNNEVLRIFSYHSVIHGKRVNVSMNVRGDVAQGDTSLENVVRSHYVYKYICTPCLGEQLSLCADVGNAHESYHTTCMLFW